MNLSVAAAVFPVIFVGELPDKTMIASLLLAARGRPRAVWAGAALAFALHVAIATTAGVLLFRLLPRQVTGLMVAVVFAAGALLATREAWSARQEERPGNGPPPGTPADRGVRAGPVTPADPGGPGGPGSPADPGTLADPGGTGGPGTLAGTERQPGRTAAALTASGRPRAPSRPAPTRQPPLRHTLTTAFLVIFAAEWGDLTQILTANMAARYHEPVAVGVGALLALWSVAGLAVIGGQRLRAALRPVALRTLSAALLAGLAIYSAWAALS